MPPALPAANLVANGGFESGMTHWVDWGNASVFSGQANSGASALGVGTAAGGAGQIGPKVLWENPSALYARYRETTE